MEQKILLYSKILAIPFFFFLFFIHLASATAFFSQIPDVRINTFQDTAVNLNNYCNYNCVGSSYNVQFINPDTNQQERIFPTGSSTNSYFRIGLDSQGLLILSSFDKAINTPITVYGADQPLQSQNKTKFNLIISVVGPPAQIQSIAPVTVYGTDTKTIDMNFVWNTYQNIKVSWYDDYNDQLQQVSTTLGGNNACNNDQREIRVCLSTSPSDIKLLITGVNRTYPTYSNNSQGRFFISANNAYGTTESSIFQVNTYPQINGTTVLYSSVPARLPFSIAPVNLYHNDQYTINLTNIYSNFTYAIATFNTSSQIGYIKIYTNGTLVECATDGTSCLSGSPDGYSFGEGDFSNGTGSFFTVRMYPNFALQIISVNRNLINYPINISACNNIGCTNTDFLGNHDSILVNITNKVPSAIPQSIAPVIMGYSQTKSYNLNNFFQDYDIAHVYWFDDLDDSGQGAFGMSNLVNQDMQTIYIKNGNPIYQVELFNNSVVTFTSGNTTHNFTMYMYVCDNVGNCVNGTTLGPYSLNVSITGNGTNSLGQIQNGNGFFNNVGNSFLGIFPDSNGLSSGSKTVYVFITMTLFTVLFVYLGVKVKASGTKIMWVVAFIDFVLLLFFTALGYASPLILTLLALAGVGFMILKFRSGR